MRFVISFLFGFVVEIATGLVIAGAMLASGGATAPSAPVDFPAWVPYIAMGAGATFTFLLARWRASRDPARAMIHALLVTVAAIALHLVTSFAAGQPFTVLHLIADVCKLVAGVAAGLIVRSQSSARVLAA